ncbi:nucleotide-diphospho-sugar transferase [Coniella lustricola]|uniref:Nucleotide-diphospho-sugar transferase n=1 Tax=Coniella lustricola TaxID=2025994 RepID=A0A2T3AED2_9PEZI|nr:nucleotide-diphospho-sugar transferase [Coniella lustricola]
MTFLFVFLFRYTRFVVHFITGVFLYRPAVSEKPLFTHRDVAVVIPTVAPHTEEFLRCCETVLQNHPQALLISTVGPGLQSEAVEVIRAQGFEARYPNTRFEVLSGAQANKRRQVMLATDRLDAANTPITICVDDHVYWSPNFLASLLPAFDDPKVALVGTNKKVVRSTSGGLWASFTNFIACLYLCRHNFQIRSEPYLDGGVFVISGRTAAYRTEIFHAPSFRQAYTNEMFLFGRLGPLNPDDDNAITRWVLKNGWKIRVQYTDECRIVTPLGEPHKFYGQVLRWTRTTFRSNCTSLRTPHTWVHFPWSVYAVYFSGMINFALFWDPLLVWTLMRTTLYTTALSSDSDGLSKSQLITFMIVWILASKLVKIAPHFVEHPFDIFWLPAYYGWAYWHSFVKLWCALTFFDHGWTGRNLAQVEEQSGAHDAN